MKLREFIAVQMSLTSYIFRPPFVANFRDVLYGGYITKTCLCNLSFWPKHVEAL
jgi:hypothetical protein